MKKVLNNIICLLAGCFAISCSSLVYSPSINLPDKIQNNETKISAAYERLPLTNENEDKELSSNGAFISLQHSFFDYFCIQIKYWSDLNTFSSENEYKHGLSITGYLLLNDSTADYRFYLVPTIGTSLLNKDIKMGTIGSWIALQTPSFSIFKPYAAAGFLYGNTNVKRKHYGFGILANIGTNINIYRQLNLSIEFSVPTLINMETNAVTTYFAPTIGFTYSFD